MILSAGLPLALALVACSGDDSEAASDAAAAPALAVPAELVAGTWQVRMAKTEARAPFEGRTSWTSYFQGRRGEALPAFKSESDAPGLARMHAEYASMYRQAALLAANATLQVYGADRQPSDPAEVDYLLGVSGVLTNNPERTALLGKSGASKAPPVATRDAAWAAWVAARAPGALPDSVAGLELVVGDAGTAPPPPFTTFKAPLVGEPGEIVAGDPADMYAMSRWHEARAREADPASAEAIDQWLDGFRLPMEPAHAVTGPAATDTWLFASPFTSAADMQLVARLAQGQHAAVDELASQSVYAATIKSCMAEGKLSVDCMVDSSASLGKAIEAAMTAANGGTADSFHRPFADFARLGALRAGDLTARALGDTDASGRLRLNAFDRNIGAATDPSFTLFMAAWDAGNRNSPRATEIVHQHLSLVPGLEIARAPLDALHVRLSRNATPGVPMH